MAAIDVSETLQETEQTNTTQTYADVLSIGSGSWVASGKYLVMVSCRIGCSSNAELAGWRMEDDAVIPHSEHIVEPRANAGSAVPQNYPWWGIYDVPATPEAVRLRHNNVSSVSTTVYTDAVSIIKMRLDDDLVENTDWRFAENTTITRHTDAFVTRADTGSFTPGTPADHRLILGLLHVDVRNFGKQHDFELQQSIDGGAFTAIGGSLSQEGEDGDETLIYAWLWEDTSGSSGTRQYRIQSKDESTAGNENDHLYSSIFVLELNAFESHACDQVTSNLAGTDSLQVLNTIADYTPTTTGNHVTLTGVAVDTGAIQLWKKGFEIDDVDSDADFLTSNSQANNDATDDIPHSRYRMFSFASGGQKLEQVGDAFASTGNFQERLIVAFSAELAAAGGDATATPAALVVGVTFDATTRTASATATTASLVVGGTFDQAVAMAGSTVVATALVAAVTFDATTRTTSATATATTLVAGVTFDPVVPAADSLVSATALVAAATFDQPAVFADGPVSPAALVVGVTFDPAVPAADSLVSATALVAGVTFDATTRTASAVATTNVLVVGVTVDEVAESPQMAVGTTVLPAALTFPAVVATGSGDATATPAALVVGVTFDATTRTASATATTVALVVAATFDGVVVVADSLVVAVTLVVGVTLDATTRTASATATTVALVVAATFDPVVATGQTDATATLVVLVVSVTFDPAVPVADSLVSPAALVASATFDPIVPSADSLVSPAALVASVTFDPVVPQTTVFSWTDDTAQPAVTAGAATTATTEGRVEYGRQEAEVQP